jgi:prepilin-type N-terminal cleavage/methylation domain-containing protein
MKALKNETQGFTLLELLIVVGILAIVGTGGIVAYDGLSRKAEKGKATYDIGSLDSAIRTFATINKDHPNNLDSLVYSATGDGSDSVALDILPEKLQGKLGPYTLTAEAVSALDEIGVTDLRFVDGTTGYPNDGSDKPSIPNRVFDNATRGAGVSVALSAGVIVAAVENIDQADFGGSTPSDSSRLRDIAGLDENLAHVVVALGIGNNSTFVKNSDSMAGGLSEAPTYPSPAKDEYSRYLALYHLGTSTDGTLANVQYREKAKFLGVIDTYGDWLDEEYAEYTGQKD